LVVSHGAHPFHQLNLELVDHWFTQLHLGEETKNGKILPKQLGKKLNAKQCQGQKDSTQKLAGGNEHN